MENYGGDAYHGVPCPPKSQLLNFTTSYFEKHNFLFKSFLICCSRAPGYFKNEERRQTISLANFIQFRDSSVDSSVDFFPFHFENAFMSPRREKTLDCGWESKVVFKSWLHINVVLPTNKLVILSIFDGY